MALRSQLRLLAFVAYFFIGIGTLFMYRFTQKPKGADFAESFTTYVGCWAARM